MFAYVNNEENDDAGDVDERNAGVRARTALISSGSLMFALVLSQVIAGVVFAF